MNFYIPNRAPYVLTLALAGGRHGEQRQAEQGPAQGETHLWQSGSGGGLFVLRG